MSSFQFFHQTQSSGTAIIQRIDPQTGRKIRLTSLVYTAGATAHDLILMRAANQVATTAAALASATALVLDSASFAGQTLASGDYIVVEHADGTYGHYLISALATLTITIGALSKAVNAGAKVWIIGATGETWHSTLKSIASTRIEFRDEVGGIAESGWDDGSSYARSGAGDPMLIYSANGTNAGVLDRGAGVYF
jgi:hypothetical protein